MGTTQSLLAAGLTASIALFRAAHADVPGMLGVSKFDFDNYQLLTTSGVDQMNQLKVATKDAATMAKAGLITAKTPNILPFNYCF